MTDYKKLPPTKEELILWKRNKNINPRTNRKITNKGKIYKLLQISYSDNFSNNYDPLDSLDDKDPVTLELFWLIENNTKKLVYKDLDNLVYYKDKLNNVRCFEKTSLEHLKAYNITKHPVTGDEIPEDIFNLISNIPLESNKTIEQKALEVFQLFTYLSIFIDYNLFVELNDTKINKLYYETKDFYYENISINDREKIEQGTKIFSKAINVFNELSLDEKKDYLLCDIKKLLQVEDESLKFMINYIVLGGLSIVIPQIKNDYPDFCFSF